MSVRVSSGKDSKQDYGTPWPVFYALKRYFPFAIDLAAHKANAKCPVWFGPGGKHEDTFKVDWNPLPNGKYYWLNPEYNDIQPYYERCAYFSRLGAKICSLVPMDAPPSWFDYVPNHAGIWHLQGRIKFDGAEQSGSKDSALHIWGPDFVGKFRVYNWRKDLFLI